MSSHSAVITWYCLVIRHNSDCASWVAGRHCTETTSNFKFLQERQTPARQTPAEIPPFLNLWKRLPLPVYLNVRWRFSAFNWESEILSVKILSLSRTQYPGQPGQVSNKSILIHCAKPPLPGQPSSWCPRSLFRLTFQINLSIKLSVNLKLPRWTAKFFVEHFQVSCHTLTVYASWYSLSTDVTHKKLRLMGVPKG